MLKNKCKFKNDRSNVKAYLSFGDCPFPKHRKEECQLTTYRYIKISAIVFLFLFVAVLTCLNVSAESWYDSSWHFRVPVNISSSAPVSDAKVQVNINFSSLLSDLGVDGEFNSSSIRVVENSVELPHDWENESDDKGNVIWIAEGTTQGNRTFWIYFDIVENGEKDYGEIISQVVHYRSGYTNNMDVYSDEYSRAWAQSIEVSWKWSTEQFYDYAYLYVDGTLSSTKDGNSSENATFSGSSLQGRFRSDGSGIYSTTDGYGTYGCGIDIIKFYPVSSYNIVSYDTFLLSPEMMTLQNNLINPVKQEAYDQGDIISLQVNVTDSASNPVTGADVVFIIQNLTSEYQCNATENSGLYVCLWNSSQKSIGNYSITVNSSKEFYNPNSTLFTDWFSLTYGPPLISVVPFIDILQGQEIQINASVQDRSGTGIQWTKINITKPDNTTYQGNMTNVSGFFIINFSDTSQRGIYRVGIFSSDNNGKIGNMSTNFSVSINLNVSSITQASYYYQGDYGRVLYSLVDGESNPIEGANVTFYIENPSGYTIWDDDNEIEITNSDGFIEPLPIFHITSSDEPGNYTLYSFTIYYDPLAGSYVNSSDSYIFEVYPGNSNDFLTLDLEAPEEVSVGNDLLVSATVTDGSQNIDPDFITVSLYDPLDNLIVDNVSMDYLDIGLYTSNYATSVSSTQGHWRWIVQTARGSNVLTKQIYTHFVGGPFDVKNITILDNIVTDLGVSVLVENKGSAGMDVILEWNLSRVSDNSELDYGGDTVYVPGSSFVWYIANPSTDYVGDVKITFVAHYAGTEKAGAYEVFTTVAGEEKRGGGGGGGGGGGAINKLEIVNYTKEVDVEKGGFSVMTLLVRNLGNTNLSGIAVSVTGVESGWVELPDKFDLNANESKYINVGFTIPFNAAVDSYNAKVIVSGQDASDSADFVIKVFGSKAELYLYKIQLLKARIKKVEGEIIQAQVNKKDVTEARGLLDQARGKVTEAELFLNSEAYEEADDAITLANDFLDRAEFAIQMAGLLGTPFTQKWTFYLLLLILFAIIVFVIWILTRLKKMELKLSGVSLKRVFMGKAAYKNLEKEKAKLEKILKLIEKEYNENMISKDSYEEIKNKNLEKLNEVDQMLKDSK